MHSSIYYTESDSVLLQLVSILLSCLWFGHPLSYEQMLGAVSFCQNIFHNIQKEIFFLSLMIIWLLSQVIVFGALYAKGFLRKQPQKALPSVQTEDGATVK